MTKLYYTTGISGFTITKERIVRPSGKTREVSVIQTCEHDDDLPPGANVKRKKPHKKSSPKSRFIISIARDKFACPHCGHEHINRYAVKTRLIQCENFGRLPTYVEVTVHRLYCPNCRKLSYESLPFVTSPRARMTRSLERTVVELRRIASISDIALHYGVPWKAVRDAEKRALKIRYRSVSLKDVRMIGIDELYVFSHEKSNGKYITVVRDLETGAVLNVSRGKGSDALNMFASRLARLKDGPKIDCVCMDMSNAYESWARKHLPNALIVYDHFHVIKAMNDKLHAIRRRSLAAINAQTRSTLRSANATAAEKRVAETVREEYRKAFKDHLKLPAMNIEDVVGNKDFEKELKDMLSLNEVLSMAWTLKEELRSIYANAEDGLEACILFECWIAKARATKVSELVSMAKTVEEHLAGILGFWEYRGATNAKAEGFNNKIRWLIKQAYGYRDYAYFRLKIFDLPEVEADDTDY